MNTRAGRSGVSPQGCDEIGRIVLDGRVSFDGDCVYVNGMILANILRAALPCGLIGVTGSPTLRITIESAD